MNKILIILLISLTICLTVKANTYTNPIALSAADPWIQYYKGFYYFTATTGDNTIRMRKSKTLEGIKSASNQVVFTFNGHNMWAPEFHLVGGQWYMYYTAGASSDLGSQRIHVLESAGDDPLGPYHFKADMKDPADDGFELDPSLIAINGKLYLLGSYIRNGLQDLFIRPLSNPYTPSGKKVLLSSPTLPWERQGGNVNEGPEPLQHNGKTFIIYSSSFCGTPDYKLGLLEFVGTDPLNPSHWHKKAQPVFQRNDANHVYGPGHNGFFLSPNGEENWIVFHANDSPQGKCDGGRTSRAQRFGWNSDGSPNFGIPVANGHVFASPSGE